MSAIEQAYEPGKHPSLPPPISTTGAIGWLRLNLFSTWLNAVLTIATILLLAWLVPPLLDWTVFHAQWRGTDRSVCVGDGACWVFVRVWFERFVYGLTYPLGQSWRIDLGYGILL